MKLKDIKEIVLVLLAIPVIWLVFGGVAIGGAKLMEWISPKSPLLISFAGLLSLLGFIALLCWWGDRKK